MSVMEAWFGMTRYSQGSTDAMRNSELLAGLARGEEVPYTPPPYQPPETPMRSYSAQPYEGPVRPDFATNWARFWGVTPKMRNAEAWEDGFNYAIEIMGLWIEFQRPLDEQGHFSLAGNMPKSNLLGRLVEGEEIRRRPCPGHQGHRGHGYQFDSPKYDCCQKTGWLPNESDDIALNHTQNLRDAAEARRNKALADKQSPKPAPKKSPTGCLLTLLALAMAAICLAAA